MRVTLFDRVVMRPSMADVIEVSGSEFLDMLADEENAASLECPDDAAKKAGSGFVLASYKKDATSKHLKQLSPDSTTEIFCFDIDTMTADEVAEGIPLWSQRSAVLYSTFKHTDEKPRFRLMVELDAPVPNFEAEPYTSLYCAAAESLKVKFDPQTIDRARFFFGPQHRSGTEPVRVRFRGAPLAVRRLDPIRRGNEVEAMKGSFDVATDKPTRQELSKVAKTWRKSSKSRMNKLASALEAILRGEEYAPLGSRHNVRIQLAFELCRLWAGLDDAWFASEYLAKIVPAPVPSSYLDWTAAVDSAKVKLAEHVEDTEAERAVLDEEELKRAAAMAGRLVVSFRSGYYVYSPKCDSYKGPFKSAEVPIVVRDLLGSVPGIMESDMTRSGPVLKTAAKLSHEYGTTAEGVTFFGKKPPIAWDPETDNICCQAYRWIRWEPVYHEIASDLLHSIGGVHYNELEAYLSQFRNLTQPLPALTLVGPAGTWKSRICEILSRFWNIRQSQSPSKASQIMSRFNGHLLKNPVVWSDETLAVTSMGRPQPEAYRESITATAHAIEQKGCEVTTLVSAVRHVISVNEDDKVFSSEIDADSVMATMERFLLFYTERDIMADFEKRWSGSKEMDRLRSGESLLEHIRWIERNTYHTSKGRLFVKTHTDAKVLLRARFADETLSCIWQVCFDAIMRESTYSMTGQISRLPLAIDSFGALIISPSRINDLWTMSKVAEGTGVKKPTAHKINRILTKSGFIKINSTTRKIYEINLNTLKDYLWASDQVSWQDFSKSCETVFGKKLRIPTPEKESII